MPTVAIPSWTPEGVLPPVDEANPVSATRAPYPVSLADVVMRFSTTPERHAVLQGLLAFRAALHANGYVSGFQWLDGSFMENIETLEARAPRDMDVVTFLHAPQPAQPGASDLDALDHDAAKHRFKVDGYFVEMDALPPREMGALTAYWYSVWAHRRNKAWKGFLQVELDPAEDSSAAAWLAQNQTAGGTP